MDGFHKISIIERNSFERIYVVWGETDKNPNDITSRSHMALRLDKNWKAKTSEAKIRFSCIDIAGERRNSVLYHNFVHEFVPMKRSQESSSPNVFL